MRRVLAAVLAVATGLACGETEYPHGGALEGWPTWGGDPGGTRFSRADEITRENVAGLRVAWTFRTGDYDPERKLRTSFEATPVLHEDALYLCSPFNRVFALDAETGRERWVFDPGVDRAGRHYTCRGVALHEDASTPGAVCGTRVLTGTVDMRLIALDAETGKPCPGFGTNGEVDLLRGLGDVAPGEVKVTSAPTVIGDVVAVGTQVSDNKRVDAPGGVVRGYDVHTGALVWAFDPAPPGTPPLPPDSDGPRFQRGTPNAWGVFSADPARDLLFVPTGNPSNDFYRGGRGPIDHYGSSVVALRGSTGELVWSFQTVHHDLWDYDVGAQPSLIDVPVNGTRVAAVAQPTKVGHVFLLDRSSGAPLFPIEERPAPASDVPGEESAATQPIPTRPPPLHPERIGEADLFSLTPIDAADCRERLAALRNAGPFTPPSLRGSLQFPGVAGGVNWGSAAWDPDRNLLLLTQARLATVHRLIPSEDVANTPANPPFEILFPQVGAPYALLQSVFVSSWGIPCTKPPWSELLAIDLASGELAWRVPFGSTRGQAPWPFWFDWGTPGMGGPLVTASGLVFIGAAMDGYFRAFDVETGEELWRDVLPAGGQANPMTYRARSDGPQFVVIAAGGHATLGTKTGDWVVAYALPEAGLLDFCPMRTWLLASLLLVAGPPARAADDLAATLSRAGARLLDALPKGARSDASFPFDDDEREDVRFAPLLLDGARHGELPEAAASLTEELLAVSLGPSGMAKVRQIRLNEQAVAKKDEARGVPGFVVRWMRDPGRYFLALFGNPAADAPWGYRYEGHHLSLNLSVAPGAVPATTPLFLGAQPRVTAEGVQVLGEEEAAARALLAALPAELRARATLPYVDDRGLMLGQVRRVSLGAAVGVGRGEAPPDAQAWFDRLIELFAANFAAPAAAARIAEIDAAGRDALRFAWAEAPSAPSLFYWRLQGPRTLIEMDNTTDGDHVHAVWHDTHDDFGDDLLAAHLREEHGLALGSPR